MDMYNKYKSPFGYEVGENDIDSYGVDHSGFTLRDEIEYQTARDNRESQLMQMYNSQGITENYPQYTTNFWGDAGNNYGFGSSNISSAISTHPAMNTTPTPLQAGQTLTPQTNALSSWNGGYSNLQQPQGGVFAQQGQRAAENDLLMNGMDTLYGMNRAINGITFGGLDWLGNKLGYDTKMNDYLNLKDDTSRNLAQTTGQFAEYGGNALSGGALAQAGYNQGNMLYNGYQIGKAYDKLSKNPYQGNGTDVIARMKNHNGEPVVLQRGEAIPGENGQPVVYGKDLRRATGTERNYGLNKGIHKHGVNREDAQRIPRVIQQKPFEINNYGQNVYLVRNKDGIFKVVTSLKDGDNIISSMYYQTR